MMHIFKRRILNITIVCSFIYSVGFIPAFADKQYDLNNSNYYNFSNSNCQVKYKNSPFCKDHPPGQQKQSVFINNNTIDIITTSADKPVVGIAGTNKNNEIINNGVINISVTPLVSLNANTLTLDEFFIFKQNNSKGITHSRKNNDDKKYHYKKNKNDNKYNGLTIFEYLTPNAIGILGGKGHDTIVNNGELNVAVTNILNNQTGTALSYAVGIAGQNNNDHIVNNGIVTVHSSSKIDIFDISLELINTGDASRKAIALGSGLMGNHGKDTLINNGQLNVTSEAIVDVNKLNISLINGINDLDSSDKAWAAAIGIVGGDGNDSITNNGNLLVQSNAVIDVDELTMSLLGLNSEVDRTAMANVFGITGDGGHDYINNSGKIDATSNATLDWKQLSIDFIGGATTIDTSNQAKAEAIGIDGGDGHDHIFNQGITNVAANATVLSTSVDTSLISVLQGDNIRAPIIASTDAGGIEGGEGHDVIDNTGSLTVTATSKVDALNLDISVVDLSSGNMSTESQASAMGINGGKGKSKIHNNGDINVTAIADTNTKSFDFKLIDLSFIPDLFGTGVDTSTTAMANAIGINTGNDHDWIFNEGDLTVTADATTYTFGLSMSADGVSNVTDLSEFPDFFLNEPVVDSSTTAKASVMGITSGDGHDVIKNSGSLITKATADVSADDIGVDLPLPDIIPPVLPNFDTTEVATDANATSIGIMSGEGHDNVFNNGSVYSEASAKARSLSVKATIGAPIPSLYDIPYSIEANLVDVGAQSETSSVGIDTGNEHDLINSKGDITAKAITETIATDIGATVAYADDKVALGLALANASTEGKATAVGITTGSGNDSIYTAGALLADSYVDTNSTTVKVSVEARKDTVLGIGASVTRANTTADSASTGINLGSGNDEILNDGWITSKAHNNADSVGVDVDISIPVGSNFGILGSGSWVTTNTIATSRADGIVGGEGKDTIFNTGTTNANTLSDSNSDTVAAKGSGTQKGAAIGVALTQAKSEAIANSNAISGGADQDKIKNSGTVTSKAVSDVNAVSVAAILELTDKGLALSGTAADGSSKAKSNAEGITGDAGSDHIKNTGTVDVFSDSDALTVSASVSASGANTGVALGLALSRATSEAESNSFGISGGSNSDWIYSSGLVKSHADTDVTSGSGSLGAGGAVKGVTAQGAAADGSTIGTANAMGISGDHGKDKIVNKDMVDVLAEADATSISVAVTGNGAGTGVALGIALARATSEAIANSVAISGGTDSDSIFNLGKIKSHAKSKVIAGSVALSLGGAGTGLVIEGAAADGLSKGFSSASGITGDKGNDLIQNEAELDVYSEADTTSFSVAASANGAGTGVSVGVALARAASETETKSIGISGGSDNDIISNTGLLTVHSKSFVEADGVSAAMGGVGTGVALQGAAADASTVGQSSVIGISGGDGIDTIYNEGDLDVLADVDANSLSIGVSVSGSGTGVGLGVSLARSNTKAIANVSGISLGGAGNSDDKHYDDDDKYHHNKKRHNRKHDKDHDSDESHDKYDRSHYKDKHHDDGDKWEKTEYLENFGKITADSVADAVSTSVSVQLGVTGTGLQAGAALADASTTADATSNGIEGSDHKDIIINHNTIDTEADADATTTSVGVSLNASLTGASLSAAITDATAKAGAFSTGIAGLSGNDKINNLGFVNANSRAETNATSVSVALSLSYVPLGASIADTTAIAEAFSFGLDGGEGNDYLQSSGIILSGADSEADGISVSFTPLGLAVASADINAESTSVGMEGDSGNDFILQTETGSITSTSHADASGTVVSATLIGAAGSILLEDASTTSYSLSIGLSGGAGYDYIENNGSIYSEAHSEASGTSVSVSLIGAAFADLSTTSISSAVGIASGDDKDKVFNKGAITTYALSSGEVTSVAATLAGYSEADASSSLSAETTAIELGAGNDSVFNEGSLTIAARSDADATAGSGTLVGVSKAKSNITANVFARGIAGGTGNDQIVNNESITVGPKAETDGWMSSLVSTSFSLTLVGVADAESSLTSLTRSIGLDGEADNDHIYNTGALNINATSYNSSTATSIGIFGTSESSGISGAITEATGIEGGDGEDKIGNLATIGVATNSYAKIDAVSFTFAGTSEAGGSLEAATRSIGISGGNDKDLLFNEGAIDVDATSTLVSVGTSTTIFGTSVANPSIGANTVALGIDAGNGGGLLKNQATIDVTSNSNLDLYSKSFTLAGTSAAKGKLTATSNATGISTGDGLDKIWTEQNITVDANATLNSFSGSKAIFGTSDASTTSGAVLNAVGIESGAGNDLIQSRSLINVEAKGQVNLVASSYTFGGTSKAGGTLGALASAMGILGGAGDDYIQSEETIRVKASSLLNSTGRSSTTFGTSASDTTVGAVTTVMGLDGATGNDEIWNLALLDIISGSTVSAYGSSSTFGGGSTVSTALVAKDNVTGINAGSGNDKVFNHGNVVITSNSNLTSKGGASSGIAGNAASIASVTARSNIAGIDTGAGFDTIVNTVNISGTARANANSVTQANAGNFFSDGKSRSKAYISNNAKGVNIGSQNNTVLNQGNINFTASGRAYAKSISRGKTINNIFGIDQDAYATSTANVSKTEVLGITGGNGINEIQNSGTINVNVLSEAYSNSNADGDAVISGDGTSYAYSYANNAKAYGIKLGYGNNWVMNEGNITVKTKPKVNAYSESDADGVGVGREPDSRANAYAYANNALAVGVSLSNGSNMVVNKGIINVKSAPNADKANAFGGYGGDVLGIDGFARAIAQANYATAYGIQVGYGNNEIWNLGTLTVASKPRALTRAHADGVGFDGDASVWSNASAHSALAVGIRTGNGHNNIINEGVINVYAYPYANAVALAHEATTGEVERYQRTENTSNAQAIGIWTGNGNDFIVNKKHIYVDASGSSPVEVAIRTGAGNDVVSLEHASYTRGTVDLGSNNDTLNIVGTPVLSGYANGGSQTDTVIFYGDGIFTSPLINFENTVKKDLGTYTVTGLAPMKQITVDQGVLRVDGDYTFNLDGTFVPSISTQQFGQIEVTGTVTLAGDINVVRGRGHYLDGEHYHVLKASKGFINNTTFDNVLIPKAATLLRFHYKQNDDNLEIHTEVKPFMTVATTDNEKAIANYLDNLLENAKGDVSAVLGEIQALGKNEHNAAFSDLSPENHTRLSHVAMSSVQKYNSHLHNRMRTLRENMMFNHGSKYPGSLSNLPYKYRSVLEAQSVMTKVNQGVWLKGFNQFGGMNNKAGFGGLDFNQSGQSLGFDKSINNNWVVGGSYGVIGTEMDVEASSGSGDVNSDLYSFYSSYFSKKGYIDWTFTRGEHDYLSQRNYSIGLVDTFASSEYSADVTTSSFASGYYLPVKNKKKRLEVFASLQYIHQSEPNFQETGIGGVNIAVAAFEKKNMLSQLGIRMANQHSNRLSSEIGIGWLHEFDLDDDQISASFANVSGSSFTIKEEDLAEDGLLFNAGLTFSNHRGIKTSLEYNTEIRKGYTTQSVMGNLNYNF